MLLTTIIVSYNTKHLLDECLSKLRQADARIGGSHCVVVDNASRDGSADHLALHHPEVQLIRLPENIGFGRANNVALPFIQSPYVLLLNTDAMVPPESIEASIASLMPTGSTPSGTAVRDAQALGSLNDPKRAQYIILITDGGPGCGGEPDSCSGTVGEITKARMKSPSISTFVVGFGGGLAASESICLTQMANAGGKPTTSAEKYYKADTADELNRALAEILKVVTGGGEAGAGDGLCYR